MDIAKLKVPELRKELKARGLPTTGNKNELMERLEMAIKNKVEDSMSAESVDDLNEDLLEEEEEEEEEDDEHLDVADSVLNDLDSPVENATSPLVKPTKRKSIEAGESPPKLAKKIVLNRDAVSTEEKSETESIENKSPEEKDDKAEDKKVIKLSQLSAKERLEMRAKKFGVTLSGEAKKVARAERFGPEGSQKSSPISAAAPPSVDVLKQRAQRFGVSVSTALTKLENQERLEKRKERFGGTANGSTTISAEKAQARLERFKQPIK